MADHWRQRAGQNLPYWEILEADAGEVFALLPGEGGIKETSVLRFTSVGLALRGLIVGGS
jgi:hypothetical protein